MRFDNCWISPGFAGFRSLLTIGQKREIESASSLEIIILSLYLNTLIAL